MNQIEELKSTLQNLCNNSSEDTANTAELLTRVLDVCTENNVLKSKVEELKIFSDNLITRLEKASRESERIQSLEDRNAELTNKISSLNDNATQKDIVINDLQKQLSDKEGQIKSLSSALSAKDMEIGNLTNSYNDLEAIRKSYDSLDISPYYEKLSDKMKDSLSNVFCNPSTHALLSSGVQETNIKQLYGILEDSVREYGDKGNDYAAMYQIVSILFSLYNIGRKEPYSIIKPAPDTPYNDNEHIIFGNQYSGAVTKTLLFGYKTAKGTVQKKAFVEVS